ncbi:alpha/beta hydrolase family protein [Portibacter marinus]|uniref:alpha/beta hydrolase family protein n=1 Tax=Portibacter marinus TaxID=2898660 RepID=UPI001F45D8C0|nr:tetratricopeptide repeat protein [Portibacter marinus]
MFRTLYILLAFYSLHLGGQDYDLYRDFKVGPYSVGFTDSILVDYSRMYKDTFRQIPVSIWFPTTKSSGPPLKIIDYLKLYNKEDASNKKVDLDHFWSQQFESLSPHIQIDQIFQTNSIAQFAPLPKKDKFPIILYASGGQGESFENFLLCEMLASHGFVVAAIPSIGTHNHEMEITKEGLMTQFQDLQVLLSYLNQQSFIDFHKVGAMGWSWGGLATLFLQTAYPFVQGYASLDGSIAGYSDILELLPYYGKENLNANSIFFTTVEDTKARTSEFVSSLVYTTSTLIALDSIQHSDFSTYTYLKQVFNRTNPNENIMEFYPFLSNTLCEFFTSTLKSQLFSTFKLKDSSHLIEDIEYHTGLEKPLREDQLINLIRKSGVAAGRKAYERMKCLNADYQPFHSFEMTKLAFTLVRDHQRSQEAVEVMKMVIQEYPDSAASYALRGRIYEIQGNLEKALSDFEKALSFKEDVSQPKETVFYEDVSWYQKKIEELEERIKKE